MAMKKVRRKEVSDEKKKKEEPAPAAAEPAQQTQEVIVDDSGANAGYANFCRVSSTPEELILDLGLNPTPYATGKVDVKVNQRIILNHFTAKRLWSALSMAFWKQTFASESKLRLLTDLHRRLLQPADFSGCSSQHYWFFSAAKSKAETLFSAFLLR